MRFKNKTIVFFLVVLALLTSAIICQFKGDKWEEIVRNGLYTINNDSIPNYAREQIDEKGIPYVYYTRQNGIEAGNQYNPTIISNYALDYYKAIKEHNNPETRKKFLNCVEWLANNISYSGNYGLYIFKWQQPWYHAVSAPYTSGMTSGRAIEVFTAAYKLYKSPKYLQAAKLLLNGFFVPIDSGGFTYKEPHGWWYEEIAGKGRTPRILDGHIFSILGVREYWLVTKDDSAAMVIEKGLQSLKHYLPAYDANNGMIYYDAAQKLADKKYHRILTNQLKELVKITGDPVINTYYKKWMVRLNEPYLYRIVKEKNRSGILLYLIISLFLFVCLLLVYGFVLRNKKNKALNKQ